MRWKCRGFRLREGEVRGLGGEGRFLNFSRKSVFINSLRAVSF